MKKRECKKAENGVCENGGAKKVGGQKVRAWKDKGKEKIIEGEARRRKAERRIKRVSIKMLKTAGEKPDDIKNNFVFY